MLTLSCLLLTRKFPHEFNSHPIVMVIFSLSDLGICLAASYIIPAILGMRR